MGTALIPASLGPLESDATVIAYGEEIDDSALGVAEFFVPAYMGHASTLQQMADMPHLQVCQLLTAGYDNAIPYLRAGVVLCNAAGVHDASTAELAVGLVLSSLRGIDNAARDMAAGRWQLRNRPALADKHVVIVGAGGVGRAIHRRLEPFEVTISVVGRTARPGVLATSDLPMLLPEADVVILALPLDPSTEHMVDASFLASMRDGALLVNVARGGIVDTDALVGELSAGRIRAALDVTDPEPLPANHELWRLPGVLITPHV
ncbi:MAG: NAD(P)-dependent oxidoreductase, partial [bacterium]|nr:NAD(P)-dependent oxidoreductase [bacterium]